MHQPHPRPESDSHAAAIAPLTRRRFLATSGLCALSHFWTDWLHAASTSPARGKGGARAVILIFNCGAPSHLDLWDPKPEASEGIRGTVNGPSIIWDTHKENFRRLKDRLVPPMEQAFAALIDDLADRSLLESTLVVWLGDFGRTPQINKDAGRDHWPHCYAAVLAGGGIRGGQVVGQADRLGAHPKEQPMSPADLHATLFRALGYDPHALTYLSAEGRPFPLSDGQPLRTLL